ncbi:MazG-like family protein [Streptomyces sp. bgisy022]|uniref:MazG-like family protein n=1 Tax=Streptomyces sp. bgisy022 TaxID=3413769 RepID=UPI003D71171A
MSDSDAPSSPPAAPPASPPPAPEGLWESVDALCAWLDAERPVDGTEGLLLRILKLSEEVGEVAQAVVGVTGQNPRKGTTHTWDDVRSEVCDVALTALVTLRTLTPDAPEVFARHLEHVRHRSLGARRSDPSAV